jgi:Ca2+-binding EF-hand superfamily protein
MISKRTLALSFLAAAALFSGDFPAFALFRRNRLVPFAVIDTDHDDTLDLTEVKTAATVLFNKLDTNHRGTLSRRELRGRMSAFEFWAADLDKDRRLTKDAYLALVEQRFVVADRDNDGTLTAAEFYSRAGLPLRRLVR